MYVALGVDARCFLGVVKLPKFKFFGLGVSFTSSSNGLNSIWVVFTGGESCGCRAGFGEYWLFNTRGEKCLDNGLA